MHAIPPDGTELLDTTEDVTTSFDGQESSLKGPAVVHQETVMLPPPINRCPPEVLCIIFRLAIHQKPTHVRRLLLVCRFWCSLVIQDPLMWSTIKLAPEDWNLEWWAGTHLPFVKRCLERSCSTFLDITLDLLCLESIDEDETSDSEDDRKCRKRSWDRYLMSPEHVFGLIEELTGPEGKLMERWQSLDLIFPVNNDMAYGIWNMISYPLPNLSRLRLYTRLPIYEEPNGFESRYLVKTLQFTINELNNWGFLNLLPPSLQELSICTNFERTFLRQLARLTRLRRLTLMCIKYYTRTPRPPPKPTMRIELPFLQNFRIETPPKHMSTVEFSFPALEDLVLVSQCKDHEWLEFPMVEQVPISVHWESRDCPPASEMIFAKAVIRRILLHFDGAQYLSVPACAKDAFLDLLREMLSEESLPRSWKTASFCDMEELKETVDIASLSAKE